MEFVCCLYGAKGIKSLNEARYQMFCGKKKMPEPQKLPPTKDCLSLHRDRTNFVVRVWKLSLEAHPLMLNPTAHGWTGGNQRLQIKWISKKPAPDSLLKCISCNCKANNSCSTQRCRCRSNGLKMY